MAKTDKELTVEIVNNYVNSWNGSDRTNPIKSSELTNLIVNVHATIRELPETNQE
jgi:predicted transcriptional regulator